MEYTTEFSMNKVNEYVKVMDECTQRVKDNLPEGYSLARDIWINNEELYSLVDDFQLEPMILEALARGINEVKSDKMRFFLTYSNGNTGATISIISTDSLGLLFDEESEDKFRSKYYSSVIFSDRYGIVKSISFTLDRTFGTGKGIVEFNGFFLADEIVMFLKELNIAFGTLGRK